MYCMYYIGIALYISTKFIRIIIWTYYYGYWNGISPIKYRCRVVSANELMITAGVSFSYFIAYVFQDYENGWRYQFMVGVIFAIFQLLAMFMLPESPRWLYIKDKKNECKNSLYRVYQ